MDVCRPVRGADRLQILDSRHNQRWSASRHADEPCSSQQFGHCALPLHHAGDLPDKCWLKMLSPQRLARPHGHAS
eukprot:symbB.v1.2.036769.t1/scaffold5268.1/size29156/3